MPTKPEFEYRVRHSRTGGPDNVQTAASPKQVGETYRKMRTWIDECGQGGEVAIEERPVNPHPWTTVEKAVLPSKPDSAPTTVTKSGNSLAVRNCIIENNVFFGGEPAKIEPKQPA